MLLCHPSGPGNGRPARLIAIFGVGLLGGAVRDALFKRGLVAEPLDLEWTDANLERRQLAAIRRAIEDKLDGPALAGVGFLWSAGRADFASSAAETQAELASFARVVDLAETIAERGPAATATFHLLSSIGGLFEGQRQVDRGSRARVLRPYGELKQRQEDLLLGRESSLGKLIYRLTSVFGTAAEGARRGLITTLVHNGQRRRSTRIVGRLTTLRDFVWSEDVARYLAGELLRPTAERQAIRTLASGKPSSIFEILKRVESILGRRPYIQFDDRRSNSLDITVSPAVLPGDWRPTDLTTAVSQICRHGFEASY